MPPTPQLSTAQAKPRQACIKSVSTIHRNTPECPAHLAPQLQSQTQIYMQIVSVSNFWNKTLVIILSDGKVQKESNSLGSPQRWRSWVCKWSEGGVHHPWGPVGFGWVPSSLTSSTNKAPELSLPLFVRLWVPVKQTNLNRLLLAVDPVLIGWLCNMEAVSYPTYPLSVD